MSKPSQCDSIAGRGPWILAVTLFAVYSALSVSKHRRMDSSGYDLGIFEQAVRNYAHLRPPIAELKGPGFNLLGDHFHPVLVLVAPFLSIVSEPHHIAADTGRTVRAISGPRDTGGDRLLRPPLGHLHRSGLRPLVGYTASGEIRLP